MSNPADTSTTAAEPIGLKLDHAQRGAHMLACGLPSCSICYPPEPLGAEFTVVLNDNRWELYERS